MLLRLLEEGRPVDEIVFCDTRLEFPEMYNHIDKVEKYIQMPITRLQSEFDFDYWMFEYKKKKGKKTDVLGYGPPWMLSRWCTSELKTKVMNKHKRDKYGKNFKHETKVYIGISLDEKHRAKPKDDTLYPLVDWKMTGKDNLEYCYKKGFDWDGLYNKLDRMSCYLCPLQRLNEVEVVYNDYPELWRKIKDIEHQAIKQHGKKFRRDYSVEQLEQMFEDNKNQITLFERW